MAQEDRSRLSEWLLLLRRQAPILRQHAGDWLEAVREEPRLIWHTQGVRYCAYALGALLLVWGAMRVTRMLAPPPIDSAPIATTADFHVACTDAACATHFVIHREFGFDDFPVECPTCRHRLGMEARPCNSAACRGGWVVPVQVDRSEQCPRCGAALD